MVFCKVRVVERKEEEKSASEDRVSKREKLTK